MSNDPHPDDLEWPPVNPSEPVAIVKHTPKPHGRIDLSTLDPAAIERLEKTLGYPLDVPSRD